MWEMKCCASCGGVRTEGNIVRFDYSLPVNLAKTGINLTIF